MSHVSAGIHESVETGPEGPVRINHGELLDRLTALLASRDLSAHATFFAAYVMQSRGWYHAPSLVGGVRYDVSRLSESDGETMRATTHLRYVRRP
jgi:hypothetical protein